MDQKRFKWNPIIPYPDPTFEGNIGLDVPIVLDLGSSKTRAGFAGQEYPFLDFISYYGRYRPTNEFGQNEESMIGSGNDLFWVPQLSRKNTYFDVNVPYHQDGVEYILDHAFGHLLNGNKPEIINTNEEGQRSTKRRKSKGGNYVGSQSSNVYDGSICHPVVFTEAPLIPLYSKDLIVQLMFECYSAPSICSGVDALFDLYYNVMNQYKGATMMDTYEGDAITIENGINDIGSIESLYSLVISSGNATTHLLPVENGRFNANHALRMSVGGSHSTDLLLKTLNLRFPEHKVFFNTDTLNKIKEDHCFVSKDYLNDLDKYFNNTEEYRTIIELPYIVKSPNVISEEEKSRKEKRKKENAQRMRDLSKKKQQEKFEQKSQRLKELKHIESTKETDPEQFESLLTEYSIESEANLTKEIKDIEKYLEKIIERNSKEKVEEESINTTKKEASVSLESLIQQRNEVIKRVELRKKEKTSNSSRQSRASKKRMRLIAEAADDKAEDELFGVNDKDWDIYIDMEIKHSEDSLAKDEELLAQLNKEINEIKGIGEEELNNEFCLDIEKIRIPEIIFQPSIIGIDQPGIGEAVHILINRIKEPETTHNTLNNIFLTGGNLSWKNVLPRIYSTISAEVPQDLVLNKKLRIFKSIDPVYGTWMGASLFALNPENRVYFITKEQYFEDGIDRLYDKMKFHMASNPIVRKL